MPVVDTTRPSVRYDVAKMATDMAKRGWNDSALAEQAQVSKMSVGRFLKGEVQTAKMAGRLAEALGFSVARYVVPARDSEAVMS